MSNALPKWLAQSQQYEPKTDRGAFVDKSILSVLKVLSKFHAQPSLKTGKAQAGIKLGFSLLLIVLLSLSRSAAFMYILLAALACRVCLLDAEQILKVLKSGLGAAIFAAFVLLPAGIFGNWYSLKTITPKVFICVCTLSLLSNTTRSDELTGALRLFFIPDLFIFVLDITIKYIMLLGEFSLNMLYALKLRSVGTNRDKRASLSGIAGHLFLRSREMAQQMHEAMICRGFTGDYKKPASFAFHWMDALVCALAAASVLLFILLERAPI